MSFFKLQDGTLMEAPNFVIGPGFELRKEQKDEYQYPVDGWTWYDSEYAARAALNHWQDYAGGQGDWNKFLDSLGKQPTVAVKVANSLLGAILMIRIQRLAAGLTHWEGADDTLISSWNASNISLTEQETAGLNALAESADLPVRVMDGKLVVV